MTQATHLEGGGATPSRSRYLVELGDATGGRPTVQALGDRARRSARDLVSEGSSVRFLRIVFLPEDDSCYLLYEAASDDEIRRAIDGAGIAARGWCRVSGLTPQPG